MSTCSEGIGRVYLLGAGFSMAASADAPAHNRMPGLRDLSDAVIDALRGAYRPRINDFVAGGQLAENYVSLRDFSFEQRYPGVDTFLASNFERWLSYLVETPPWLSVSDHARHRAAFIEVSRVVSHVLENRERALVHWQIEQASGCPEWLQRLAARWHRAGSQVITFNYDRLVELAFMMYGAPPPPGSASSDLYPGLLTPISVRAGGQGRLPRTWTNFKLYKLHGSIGWWYQGPDGPPGDVVYNVGIAGGGWDAPGFFPPDAPSHDWTADLEPMIVPPAAVKSPYYSNAVLRSIWLKASMALRHARELVVMGFSFPATDMLVASLLSTTLDRDCVITPVNPDSSVVERICETFGIEEDSPRLKTNYLGEGAISRWVDDHADAPDQYFEADNDF